MHKAFAWLRAKIPLWVLVLYIILSTAVKIAIIIYTGGSIVQLLSC